MISNPKACLATHTAAQAARLMRHEKVNALPVVDDRVNNRLIGVIRDHDITHRIVAEGLDPNSTLVSDVMSRDPATWERETSGGFSFGTATVALVAGFCLGIGAGLMFVFDPVRGPGRRAVIRGQAVQLRKQSETALNRIVREVENRFTTNAKPESVAERPNPVPAQPDAWELSQLRWSSSARVLASAAGGSLLLLALAKGKH